MSKKRVAFVIPTLHAGGMERVMSEIVNAFATYPDMEAYLILYGLKREVFYPLDPRITILKPDFEFDNSRRTYYTIKTLAYVRKTLLELKPDRVLSFGEYWNNFILLATRFTNLKVYVSDRCQPDKHLGRLHQPLRKFLYPKAAGVLAQTGRAKAIFEGLYSNSNIAVIGNPIRTIAPNPAIQKENWVLSVGRLINTKHFDRLIRIFVGLNIPDWKLVIVGDDAIKQQNMEKFKRLIQELGAEDRVVLAGKRSDVDDFYRRSKIFAFTSSSEGFPNVLGEAQSSGLPVVAYDCTAGPADLIRDGENGYLIPLFDDAKFAEQLRCLMLDENLRERMGSQAARDIQAFSADTICQQVRSFLFSE